MLVFEPNKAAQVAAYTQTVFKDLDAAYSTAARLTISLLDASAGSNMTERERQALIEKVHQSQGIVLDSRATMVSATVMMATLQQRSDQSETSFGCPGDGPWAEADVKPKLQMVAAN